jgi:hypothetical protein
VLTETASITGHFEQRLVVSRTHNLAGGTLACATNQLHAFGKLMAALSVLLGIADKAGTPMTAESLRGGKFVRQDAQPTQKLSFVRLASRGVESAPRLAVVTVPACNLARRRW